MRERVNCFFSRPTAVVVAWHRALPCYIARESRRPSNSTGALLEGCSHFRAAVIFAVVHVSVVHIGAVLSRHAGEGRGSPRGLGSRVSGIRGDAVIQMCKDLAQGTSKVAVDTKCFPWQ